MTPLAFTLGQGSSSLLQSPALVQVTTPSASEVLLVITYAFLGIVWTVIAWEVWATVRRLHTPLGMEHTRRRLVIAGLVVTLSLALDAGYWMIATAGRYQLVPGHPENAFQLPVWNIIEKMPLLLAAAAFLWTFTITGKLTVAESDRRYFARFAERTRDALTLLDIEGRIQYWNKSAERLFGWDRDQVIGRRVQDIMVPEDLREEAESMLSRVRSEGTPISLERTERMTSGRERILVSIDTAPVLDPDFVGYFSIIRPVTQRLDLAHHPYFREHKLPAKVAGKVFVAMPFAVREGQLNVWDSLLVPIADELDLTLVRADRQLAAHGVVDQVFHDIWSSELVVADLTGDNPNVYYEVGLAHALGVETLHLLGVNETIPFNVRHLQIIYCDPLRDSKSRDDVRKAIISKRKQ